MHIKRKIFKDIYWPKLKVNVHLRFHSNRILIASAVFLTANESEQHIFLSYYEKSRVFLKNWNFELCKMIRCSDSWNFMFIRLFVQELFHFVFHKKWKNFTVLKCHIIFDHVHICYKSLMKMFGILFDIYSQSFGNGWITLEL